MQSHADTVQQQFDPRAEAYLHSAAHAQGADLVAARTLVTDALPPGRGQALDVGCGAGHLAFALAPHLANITALDPSPAMCATVAQAAGDRRLHNIHTCEATAEALPFADKQFDLVSSRYSAHHWGALPQALREMRRVVKPGGWLLMIDVLGADQPLVDTHLQTIELLRDRSHVRNRAHGQWLVLLREAGFTVRKTEQFPLRLAFDEWVARMRTPAELAIAIRRLQREAPAEVQRALGFEDDGSFTVRTGLYWAQTSS